MTSYLSQIYELATNFIESTLEKSKFNQLRENLIVKTGIDPDDLDFQFESYQRTVRAEKGFISDALNKNDSGDLYWTNRVKEFQDFSVNLKTKIFQEPKPVQKTIFQPEIRL